MKLKQKTKVSQGGAKNSVNSIIPNSIRNALELDVGDEVEWCAEVMSDGLIVTVHKVLSENNK